MEVRETVELTEKEERIFLRLLDVVDHFDLGTQLCVAGGWVRDKLLGKEPVDIDIALDNMTGQDFCMKVNEYQELIGEKQKERDNHKEFCVFPCNPDRSKHLETANMSIFDTKIDFVNLRSEKYSESSRIPTMEIGTAKEDAYRRDLIINSFHWQATLQESPKHLQPLPRLPSTQPTTQSDVSTSHTIVMWATTQCPQISMSRWHQDVNRDGPTVNNVTELEDLKTHFQSSWTVHTMSSIDDLKKGLIVTPLPAKATFLDDPLRVLRAIRFAARFDFTLTEELKEAASDEEVKSKLGCKISRERVCEEINLIMSGECPVQAMSYIRDLGLFFVVFALPEKPNPPVFDKCCVSHIEAAWNVVYSVLSGVSYPMLLDEQRRLYLYSALFIPLRNMFYLDKKSKKIPVTSYIIQDSLKWKACFAEAVVSIHAASRKFAELVLLFESNVALGTLKERLEDEYLDIPTDILKRVYAGLILDEIKDLWRVALLISIISYPEAENAGETLSQQDELHRRKQKYIRVERSITDLDLDGVWKCRPLVTGNDVMRVMQVKSCPLIGEWKKRVFKCSLRIRKEPRMIASSGSSSRIQKQHSVPGSGMLEPRSRSSNTCCKNLRSLLSCHLMAWVNR